MGRRRQANSDQTGLWRGPARWYIIAAVVLVVVIVVVSILLVRKALPALRGEPTSVAKSEATATAVPTFTPGPTRLPTDTPPPAASPTMPAPMMLDTDEPAFEFQSAGARPSTEWTGFFGRVTDTEGNPLTDVPIIVWYGDGTEASPVVRTDVDGNYEIRLADAPFAGTWSIQILTEDGGAASKLFTFQTDENTETGIQQIQVLWQQAP